LPGGFDAILCAEDCVMIVIYIAGPFRGAHAWAIAQNVHRAECAAYEIFASGHVALCPHTNTRHFDSSLPDQIFIDGTLELMRRCDAVIVLPDYKNSQGTLGEIAEAHRLGMPVAFLEGLLPGHIKTAVLDVEHGLELKKATEEGKRTHG